MTLFGDGRKLAGNIARFIVREHLMPAIGAKRTLAGTLLEACGRLGNAPHLSLFTLLS